MSKDFLDTQVNNKANAPKSTKLVLCFNTVIRDIKSKKLVLIDDLRFDKEYNVFGIIETPSGKTQTIDENMKCVGNHIFTKTYDDTNKIILVPLELNQTYYKVIPTIKDPKLLIDVHSSSNRSKCTINSTVKELQKDNSLLKKLKEARISLENGIASVKFWNEEKEVNINSIQIFQPVTSSLFLLKYNKTMYLKIQI